jgi:Flp pilus assembly pilin Flp
MMNNLLAFLRSEDGAVTIDWVVLTAAVIGIGMLVLVPIAFSTDSVATVISNDIATQRVGYIRWER